MPPGDERKKGEVREFILACAASSPKPQRRLPRVAQRRRGDSDGHQPLPASSRCRLHVLGVPSSKKPEAHQGAEAGKPARRLSAGGQNAGKSRGEAAGAVPNDLSLTRPIGWRCAEADCFKYRPRNDWAPRPGPLRVEFVFDSGERNAIRLTSPGRHIQWTDPVAGDLPPQSK